MQMLENRFIVGLKTNKQTICQPINQLHLYSANESKVQWHINKSTQKENITKIHQ